MLIKPEQPLTAGLVNCIQIMLVTLAMANALNVGLVVRAQEGTVQGQFERVHLLLQPVESDKEVIQNIGPEGGVISIEFAGATREVIFPAGAILREVPVKVTLSTRPDTTYPDDEEFLKSYPPELLKYISPRMAVEMPLDALDWQNPDSIKQLMFLDPGFYAGAFNEDLVITAEIRIQTGEVLDGLQFDYYRPKEPVGIIGAQLAVNYEIEQPETLKLSIQIVDETALYDPSIENER